MAATARRLSRKALRAALNDWSPSTYANPPQAMVDECNYLETDPRSTHYLDLGVVFKNKPMRIYGNGAKIVNRIFLPDTPVFFGDNDYTNMQTVSALTNVSINQGGTSNQNCVLIEVPDASGYAAGDMLRIGSNDKHSSSNPADNEREGEPALIYSVDTGTTPNRIYTKSPLEFFSKYITNIRIWRMNTENICEITNLLMDCDRSGPSTANSPMLKIRGYRRGFLSNVRALYSYSEMVRMEGCVEFTTFGVRGENQLTSTSLYRTGYTMVDYSGFKNSHFGLYGANCRHVFTTGVVGSTSAGANAAWSFGRTQKFHVNGKGFNTHHAAFDSHPDGYKGVFQGIEATWSSRGTTGSQHGIGLRGIGHTILGAVVHGGSGGLSVGTDYDHADNCRDHTIKDFEYIPDGSGQGLGIAIDISGGVSSGLPTAGRPTGIKIINPIIGGAAQTTQLINISNADAEIIGGNIKANFAGTSGNSRVYELNYGATLKVRRTSTDFSGVTAGAVRMAILKDDSTGNVAPCKMEYLDCEHVGGNKITFLADHKSEAGTFECFGLDTDVAPLGDAAGAGPAVYVANASAATHMIDFKVAHGKGGGRSNIILSDSGYSFASGAHTIDIVDCGGPVVRIPIKTTGAGVTITNITAGNLDGQQLIIPLREDSTNTVGIVAGGNIAASSTLDIGKEARFTWSTYEAKWYGGA